jgi:hypothetical protein
MTTLYPGRMIGSSKSAYCSMHPNNLVVFNANVCTLTKGKIWWGDLDITLDTALLLALRNKVGEDLYILYEMDGRFQNETAPLLDRAVAIVTETEVKVLPR